MAQILSCPSGPQPNWCPESTDDMMPSVLGLLPPGPAWDGAGVAGTVQNSYFRALGNVLSYLYQRMCAYVDEFFCKTVNESLDQWIAEYNVNDPCDPYGYNLCVKVAAQGGSTCDYFVDIAAQSGWVIACEDLSQGPEPIAGCFECGCTPLGPTPVFQPYGSRLGYGQVGTCDYGQVTDHPDKAHWDTTKTALASCKVPGSNLGEGPDTDESCCFICGYYDFVVPEPVTETDYCQDQGNVLYFDCPRVNVPADINPMTVKREAGGYDDTGNYVEWGNAYLWQVTVNMAASQAAQASAAQAAQPADDTDPSSQAGCLMAGDILLPDGSLGGTPLCADIPASPDASFALCFLDRVKPAHTTLLVQVNQT